MKFNEINPKHRDKIPTEYSPDILFSLNRSERRKNLNINYHENKFYGFDAWTVYELSWLGKEGVPNSGILYFSYSSSSKKFIESKSLKLYLNSLNNKKFESKEAFLSLLKEDLTNCIEEEIELEIAEKPNDFYPAVQTLDTLKIDTCLIIENPNSLKLQTLDQPTKDNFTFSNFRSLCPISSQPDWATIRISYQGNRIEEVSLLKYLASFRNYQAFHEDCVEIIFNDLMRRCSPNILRVQANYLRRGGIEINPVRSSEIISDRIVLRDLKQ